MENYNKPRVLEVLRDKANSFRSLLPCNLARCTKDEVKEYFENTYKLDECLFSALKDEVYFYKCPDRLRLPLVFYFAHTATLYVNKLLLAGLIKDRIDRHFETIFETGVDEMSWDDTENYRLGGSYKWPDIAEVMEYRQKVKEMVLHVIETAPLSHPINQEHPWWSIFMGMEHERVHLETSSVLIRQLPVDYLEKPLNWQYAPLTADSPAGPNQFIPVKEAEIELGKARDFPTYGWDNEYGCQKIRVPSFEATKYLISNKEYKEFVDAGGYQEKGLWTTEGWQWVQYRSVKHPQFWVCHRGCKSNCGADLASHSHCNLPQPNGNQPFLYKYRAMYDVIDMPWDWPVEVNYHEAKAFCAWKGPDFRLPTEAEHHVISGEKPANTDYESDHICCSDYKANLNMTYGSPTPVNFYPPNSLGFYDSYGNVWKWSEDHFNGLCNFKTIYLYDDFSSPCFDGRHNVIQGGSWVSTGDCASRFARFAFRRHFIQHAGFRIVRSNDYSSVRLCDCTVFIEGAGVVENPVTINGNNMATTNWQYEYDKECVSSSLITNDMGKDINYGQPLIAYCNELMTKLKLNFNKVLVIGSGPGYTSFLLAKSFTEVLGIDYSGRLIDIATQFKTQGTFAMCGKMKIDCPLPAGSYSTDNATFKQLTWLPNELENFDLVLFDMIDRVMEPKGWLAKLWECAGTKGLIIVTGKDRWTAEALKNDIKDDRVKLIEETKACTRTVTSWQLLQ